MNETRRNEILTSYQEHAARFDAIASSRRPDAPNVVPIEEDAAGAMHTPTARELQVLQLLADGLSNRQIAGRLTVSEETVKTHVRSLLAKLRASSRTHAVGLGFRAGLVT